MPGSLLKLGGPLGPRAPIQFPAVPASGAAYYNLILSEPGLVAYPRLNELTDMPYAVMFDSKGDNQGTYFGHPIFSAVGPLTIEPSIGVTFDGTLTKGIIVPHKAALNLGDGPFTIEAWVNRYGATLRADTAVQKGTGAYGAGFDGANNFWKLAQTGTNQVASGTAAITDSNWHHCVITHGALGAGNTLIYVDTIEGHTDGASINNALINTTSPLTIGYEPGYTGFSGSIAELALYNVVLTAAQIRNHFYAGRGWLFARSTQMYQLLPR